LTDGTTVRGQVIAGAGGPHDPLRRARWREQSLHVAVGFVLMEGDFPDRVELHFGSVAPGGYAWMIPKRGGANIGIGIQPRFARGRPLREFLAEFLARYDGRITYRGGGLLPMSGAIRRLVKPPHLLVGDSAGMVFPSNGAGIIPAMVAGRIAGQVIAEHVCDGTPLTEYERIWNAQMGREMQASQRAAWLGSVLFRIPDLLVNIALSRLSRPFVWRAITCQPTFGLF
jgi:digeranylgeranylglycerophospholipid reductase